MATNISFVEIKRTENGMVLNSLLASRSIVVMNSKTLKAWNIEAKIRKTDNKTIMRAMYKIVLSAIRDRLDKNTTPEAIRSKRKCEDAFSQIMNCDTIYVSDKLGNIVESSIFQVINELQHLKIRQIFKITKSMPVYKLFVEERMDWENPAMVDALNDLVNTMLDQTSIVRAFDQSFGIAAESNRIEQGTETEQSATYAIELTHEAVTIVEAESAVMPA